MTEANPARAAAQLPSLLLIIPAGFFYLRSLLESLDLGPDGGGPLRVLLLGLVQRSLHLVDGLLEDANCERMQTQLTQLIKIKLAKTSEMNAINWSGFVVTPSAKRL